jgi:NitT/TauT family transport system permease protein
VSITLAFVGAVISETLASNDGIGYLMLQAASQFRTPLMFAGVTVIAAMGIVAYLISVFIERRFTGWATRRQNVGPTGGG